MGSTLTTLIEEHARKLRGVFSLLMLVYAFVAKSYFTLALLALVWGVYGYRALKSDSGSGKKKLGFWKRVGRSNTLFPRKLKFTKEGKLLIGITLGIGFAAINTGNNLMYLVLGMLLSLMVVSGILSELTLRGVTVSRVRRGPAEAKKEEFFAFRVTNAKRWFVSYCVEIEEVLDSGEQISGYGLRLGPGDARDVRARLRVNERGVYESAGLSISTRFPFSFFRKSRFVPESREIIVTPALRPVQTPAERSDRMGIEESRRSMGRGQEIYGLKDFRHGDPPKDIHWKATARRRRLIAREYEAPGNKTVWLLFTNYLSDAALKPEFEEALSYVASLATTLMEGGATVGLVTLVGVVPPGGGERHRRVLLTHLARLDPTSTEGTLNLSSCSTGRRIWVRVDGEPSAGIEDCEEVLPNFESEVEVAA